MPEWPYKLAFFIHFLSGKIFHISGALSWRKKFSLWITLICELLGKVPIFLWRSLDRKNIWNYIFLLCRSCAAHSKLLWPKTFFCQEMCKLLFSICCALLRERKVTHVWVIIDFQAISLLSEVCALHTCQRRGERRRRRFLGHSRLTFLRRIWALVANVISQRSRYSVPSGGALLHAILRSPSPVIEGNGRRSRGPSFCFSSFAQQWVHCCRQMSKSRDKILFFYFLFQVPLTGVSLHSRVYTWFVLVYKISYGLGIVGYVAIMGTLFGLNVLFALKPSTSMDFGVLTIFYGLYFGVVARDFAEVLSETMAARIGVRLFLSFRPLPSFSDRKTCNTVWSLRCSQYYWTSIPCLVRTCPRLTKHFFRLTACVRNFDEDISRYLWKEKY